MTKDRSDLSHSERRLVAAALRSYAGGWFPMNEPETGLVHWVQPSRRALLPLDDRFTVSRSLRAAVRSNRFEVTSDSAFSEVIRACAKPAKGRETTWLDDSITALFELLHRAGHAHSVEAWTKGPASERVLVGGLYGLVVGSVFCGESMFSNPAQGGSNASKVCLVHLVSHLRCQNFTILDAQIHNPHLEQFGLYELDDSDYVQLLATAVSQPRDWGLWIPNPG